MDPGAPSPASSSRSSASPAHPGPSHPHPHPPSHGPFVDPDSSHDLDTFLQSFWTRHVQIVEAEEQDVRAVGLPLARIKKVMKSDEEVKMISQEVPIMFSKACEIFISELTCRAWLVAESHNRRTLQKPDVAAAIAMSDMFDFLIDIVPRDDDLGADGAPLPLADEGEVAERIGDVNALRVDRPDPENGIGEDSGWLDGTLDMPLNIPGQESQGLHPDMQNR